MNKKECVLYAKLGMHAMLMSDVKDTPRNLEMFMEIQFEKFPTIEQAREYANHIGVQ